MADFDKFIQLIRQQPNYGRAFEFFVKWFLKNDPEWSTQVDEVWLWDEWPDKWGPDCGIDLVFRHWNGDIYAVQAKCYDPSYSVSKKSIDSFLSESSRSIIDHRLLITSTGLINRNAERTCAQQDKKVTLFRLQDFQRAEINYPESFADLWNVKPTPKPKPRDHQLEAIEAVTKGFEEYDRGQLIMACGTGKTLTTLWIKERLKAKTTLVLVPSLNLLSQTLREWTSACHLPFEALCVCSDQSVGRQATDTQEDIKVSEFAFPVTEDVEEISRFLGKAGPKVVFCTYQSSALIAEAQSARNTEPFDLAIADEAHRCAGDKAGAFATILDSGLIRTDKRLFTTATPRIYASTVTKRAKERGIEVVGMDDPKVFGTELHRLTFGEAINRDLLTDYQVVIVGVDEPMIAEWIDQAELLQVNPDMATDARSLASKIALIKAIRDFNMTRVISFHSRVKAAELFSNEVGDIIALVPEEDRPTGEMWSDYVSGEMQTSERTRKIGKLKALGQGQLGILTNARCLSEGVDVPALDGIAFIDPRASQVDIIQAVGRALRHSGITGKKVGTIILPVFIEPGDDPEEQIGASAFKPVWEVLKALRAHDDLLADALDSYRTEMGRKGTAKAETKPDKIVFDLPQSVGASFSDALKTKLVEQTTTSWNFSFGLLEVYYAREGHCAVPMSHEELGYSLGGWVANQRRRKAKLSNAQILRLENLGFSWNSHTEAWDEGFRKLQQFHAREGHCLVPKAHIEDGFSLAGWVSKQRKKRHNLTPEKVKRLEALNFVWEPLKKIWDTRYNTLLQFHAREGHCLVPQAHIEDGFALGSWVATQRVRKASMLSEQIDQLNQIGFAWSAFEANWDEGFGKLLQFHAREGHCLVPRAHIEDGFALGKWVGTKRARKASMSSEQIDQLNQIGFAWNALEANWDEGFGKLLQFHAREGHCRVPLSHTEDGFRLGRWVSSQRGVLKKGKLCSERCEKLHALGFVRKSTRADTLKDRYQQNWDKAFSKLENFYKREGHCRVPTVHKEDGLKLGQWVRNQRANAKKGKLADERYARLNALGFVWDGTLTH